MELVTADPHSATDQLRALTRVARAARTGLDRPQRALLDAIQRVVMEAHDDIEPLKEISSAELAARAIDPAQALQLIRLMVVMAMADGPPSTPQVSLISDFAAALHVDEPAVKVISHLANGRRRRFRLAFLHRSHIRHYFRNTARMSGSRLSVPKALLIFRGVIREPERAARFRALEQLPEDTLGHHFYRHCVDADLAFPGEKGGFPEGAIFHDVTHVLSGYDTSPEGELKNAAFQAAFTRDDHDFFTWLVSIVLHGTRVNITPFPIPEIPGLIGQGDLALDIMRELQRGKSVKQDLGDAWDFWDYAELPIEVARERLGVLPRRATANA
jgi:uncharacterized tellurite resistance protein B-like protein